MQRNTGPQNRLPVVTAPENLPKQTSPSSRTTGHDHVGTFWDMLGIRIVFMAVCIAAGFHFRPFSVTPVSGAATRKAAMAAWTRAA